MGYNDNINKIVAGQPKGRRFNVITYVKFERIIQALAVVVPFYYLNCFGVVE